MKASTIIIFAILILFSCRRQDESKNIDKSIKHYQLIAEKTFAIGLNNRIWRYKKTIDGSYIFYILATKDNRIGGTWQGFFVRTNQNGDLIKINSISLPKHQDLSGFLELDDCYFVVSTEIMTMNGYTKDFLNKYDKNCRLIWTKKIGQPKFPDWSTVLTIINDKELLVISNKILPNSGILISKYDLEGEFISEWEIKNKYRCEPVSLIKSNDNNYLLTVNENNTRFIGRDSNTCILLKLNVNGDTVWTKKFINFRPKKTVATNENELILYGEGLSNENNQHHLKIILLDNKGCIKREKKFDKFFCEEPGDIIETKPKHFVFSSEIKPVKNDGNRTYIFELDINGNITFEEKFDELFNNNIILNGNNGIIILSEKRNTKSSNPFHQIINVTLLKENNVPQ